MAGLNNKRIWENIIFYKCSILPEINDFKLESNVLMHIPSDEETHLHICRNKIAIYEKSLTNGKNWEYFKKIVNPYEIVYTQKKYDNFPESVCILKPLSRSYFKMIEILDIIHFFDTIPFNIRTAHVCEGPGGFIEALFDQAPKHNKNIETSVAMTLRPYKTNIPGWRRATNFLKRNKNIFIIFGQDNTGNIIKPENQQSYIDYVEESSGGKKVHIFTADGGFDFSCDYMKQEQMVFPLLIASIKIGFDVLCKGGTFILKLIDFYNKATVDLLYFMSCHFEEWTLYKPHMSRPCNPEQYFIGKGFTGCSDEIMDILRIWCSIVENNQSLDSLFTTMPASSNEFTDIINRIRENSFNSQIEYLERVFVIIEKNDDRLIMDYLKKNEKTSYEWCVRFSVPIYEKGLIEELHNDLPVFSQQ